MSLRFVPKWVSLNDIERHMVVTLRYLTEFGKAAFQHITASARIELIDIVVSCSTCTM